MSITPRRKVIKYLRSRYGGDWSIIKTPELWLWVQTEGLVATYSEPKTAYEIVLEVPGLSRIYVWRYR